MPPIANHNLSWDSLLLWEDIEPYLRVHAIALVILTSSFLGGALLIFSVIKHKRYNSVGQRFPIYLGVTDILAAGIHLVDHPYNLTHLGSPGIVACETIAVFFQAFLYTGLTLTLLMSIHLAVLVRRNAQLGWGKWDWKLLVMAVTPAVLTIAVGIPFDAFGSSIYWCFANFLSPNGYYFMMACYVVLPSAFLIATFTSYLATILHLRNNARAMRGLSLHSGGAGPVPSDNSGQAEGSPSWTSQFSRGAVGRRSPRGSAPSVHEERADRITQRVLRHASSYILAFLVSWTPMQLCNLIGAYMLTPKILPMCGSALFAAIGVVHYLVYIYNERDTAREREWTMSKSGGMPGSSSSSGGKFRGDDLSHVRKNTLVASSNAFLAEHTEKISSPGHGV